MLTAAQIEALRDRSGQLLDPITDYLIEDIAKRVAKAGQFTGTASYEAWRLQQLGVSQKKLKKEIAKRLGVSLKDAEKLLTQSAKTGYNFDMSRFPTAQAIPLSANSSLQQILDATVKLARDDLTNITQTMGFVGPDGVCRELTDAYVQACDFAFQKVSTGAQDYVSAIRDATRNLAERGIRTIDYKSGFHMSIEAAVRKCIMGGMGLMQEQISQQNHDDLGCDGWEISAHGGSAPDHEPIQGKQYSDKAYKRLNNSLKRRIGTLNCGHAAFPIIMGVNEPVYTEAELAEFREENEKGVTFDGKHYTLYEATQRQRKFERSIRKQKSRILVDKATEDTEKLQTDQIRLVRLRQEYARFSKGVDLPMQHERAAVAGFTWKDGKAAEKVEKQSAQRATSYFKSRDLKKTRDEIALNNANKQSIDGINKRGTKNLISAYERRRMHFGLNMASGEDILLNPYNTFVEDFTGVSVETADAFEKTIAKLSEKYYTGLTRVEVGDPRKFIGSTVLASVTPMPTVGANTLTLNPLKTKDYSALVQRIRELSEKGYCAKVPDAKLGEYVATHEFAHTLINMKVGSYKNFVGIDANFFQRAKKELEDIYEEYISDIGNLETRRKEIEGRFFLVNNQSELSKIQKEYSLVKAELENKKISKYSLENADEFMAEGFADCILGENPSLYSKRVLEVLDRYFGRK